MAQCMAERCERGPLALRLIQIADQSRVLPNAKRRNPELSQRDNRE